MRSLPEIQKHLSYYSKENPSVAGLRVAAMLEEWVGLHHIDSTQLKKVDWSNSRYQVLKLSRYSDGSNLSTFDFDMLIRLVFLAHDHCIRVHLSPCDPQFIDATFFPRNTRQGQMNERHPTLEMAVERHRQRASNRDWLIPAEATVLA